MGGARDLRDPESGLTVLAAGFALGVVFTITSGLGLLLAATYAAATEEREEE